MALAPLTTDDLVEDEELELELELTAPEPELEDDTPPDDGPVSVEERAKAMGWKPLAEYRGDPRRWTDAAEFIRKGEEELPVLRDQSRRMSERMARQDRENADLRRTVGEMKQAIADAQNLARSASDAGYQRALSDLKKKREEAVEVADTVSFKQIDQEIEALETARRALPPVPDPVAKPDTPPAPQVDPAIQDFVRDNPWFTDKARAYLSQNMVAMHNAVIAEGRITDVGEQLVEAKARLARAFPNDIQVDEDPPYEPEEDDVPQPPARRPAPAAPTRRPGALAPSRAPTAPQGQRKSPFERIEDPAERAEVKAGYERAKSNDPGLTAGEYVYLYENPHADALAIRQQRKRT